MRRQVLIVGLVSSVFGMAALLAQAASRTGETGPKAVVVEPVIDVGVVAKGEVVSRAFEIRNDGVSPLAIQEVRPGCGCTVAKYDESIAPGATGKVHVDVDTTAFSGPIAKSVAVYTSDPQAGRIQLTIKADVQPFVAVDPGYARHFQVLGGTPGEPVKQLVWATDGRALAITGVEAPEEYVLVTTRKATAEERSADGPEVQWVVETRLADNAPVGPLAGRVVLTTNHPEQPVITVSVSGNVSPPVSVSPPSGSLGVIGSDDTGRASVLLTNNTGGDLELTIESVSVEGLKAELRTVDPKRTQLALTLPPGRSSGPIDGKVVIKTNLAEPAVIEVPIEGAIR